MPAIHNEQLRAGFAPASAAPPPPPRDRGGETGRCRARCRRRLTPPSPVAASPAPSDAVPPRCRPSQLWRRKADRARLSRRAAERRPLAGGARRGPLARRGVARRATARRAPARARQKPGQGLRKQGEPPEPGPMNPASKSRRRAQHHSPSRSSPRRRRRNCRRPKVAPHPSGGRAGRGRSSRPAAPPEAKGSAAVEPPPARRLLAAACRPPAAARRRQGEPKPPTPVDKPSPRSNSAPIRRASPRAGGEHSKSWCRSIQRTRERFGSSVTPVNGSGAVEQLDSYRTALDRAQAVAAALRRPESPPTRSKSRPRRRAPIRAKAAPRFCSNIDSQQRQDSTLPRFLVGMRSAASHSGRKTLEKSTLGRYKGRV